MPKVNLDLNSFKALASDTRLNILKTLDGKKLSLNDIARSTNLHKVTLHEHLNRLNEAGFIKKIEREGHKFVYYQLSWKGQSLLHPENTRIVIMFSLTFLTFIFGIGSLFINAKNWNASPARELMLDNGAKQASEQSQFFPNLSFVLFLIFGIFLIITLWRYKINRYPKI
jgi:DNA-binding transcriptional ArsR family regulator